MGDEGWGKGREKEGGRGTEGIVRRHRCPELSLRGGGVNPSVVVELGSPNPVGMEEGSEDLLSDVA